MTKETASMFTGVNEGYQGNNVAITDPAKAVEIVQAKLEAVQRNGGDPNTYKVFPGVVVYNEGWGCPKGGEVVAAVTTEGSPEAAVKTASVMRGELNQSTLSVGTYSGDQGAKTKGFTVEVEGDLKAVASAWQEAAYTHGKFKDLYSPTDIYVSVGMYDKGDGKVVIQAEANPAFISDATAWEKQVQAVAGDVAAKLGTRIEPKFRDAGFTYLEKPKEVVPTEVANTPATVKGDAGKDDKQQAVG